MLLRDWWLRLRALLRPARVEQDLQEELDFHLEMDARKHAAAGLDVRRARDAARRRFGSRALVEDECRDARPIGAVDTVWQDVRYALRGFRRAPTFALTVVGTIALGLGLNTAVFTVFNAYVLKPLAVRDPYSLYEIGWNTRAGRMHRLSWPELERLRTGPAIFTDILAERTPLVDRIKGHPTYASLVSGNYFRMLGVEPAVGRVLEPSDAATPGREAVAVLSYAFWQRQFGGDPSVVGRTILVQAFPCEVVGVARAGFDGLTELPSHEIWVPITLSPLLEDGPSLLGSAGQNRLHVVGRLAPGVTTRAAEAALLVWGGAETEDVPDADKAMTVWLDSKATSIPLSPKMVLALSPVVATFALVLVIACANVANMMLARGVARQREIGIRLTLGAARRRLVRQLLTESALLAVVAGAAAIAVSYLAVAGAVRVMLTTVPADIVEFMRVAPLPPDARVLAFTLGATLVTGILFGLAPALQTTRANVVQMARGDFGSAIGSARLRQMLVIVQITASITLLITSAVLLQSARRFSDVDPGVRTKDVISLDIREPFRPRVLNALAASALVRGVAAASAVPLSANASGVTVGFAGRPDVVQTRYRFVSPAFFDVFDITIVRGRNFTADEGRSHAAVTIVSESAARTWWPDRDAVGQTLRIVASAKGSDFASRLERHASVLVVGVARDTGADVDIAGPVASVLYVPTDSAVAGTELAVRVTGEAETTRRSLDRSLAVAAPGAVQQIHKLEDLAAVRLYPYRAASWVAGAVGGLALVLTVSGVYGVLSYLVAQRSKEIGIRIALGANVRDVVALVLRQSLRLAAIGAGVGVLLALGAARLFGWRIVMLQAFDPSAYAAGVLIVAAACAGASCVPARRAARIDPMTTLRAD